MVFLGYDHGYGIPGMGPWEDVHNQGGAHCQGDVPVRGPAQRVQVQGDDLGVRDHRDCDRVGQWTAVLREGHDGELVQGGRGPWDQAYVHGLRGGVGHWTTGPHGAACQG